MPGSLPGGEVRMLGEIEILLDVVAKGDLDLLQDALREKPSLAREKGGVRGWTLLHEAASRGRAEMVELLLDHGADLGARDKGDHATPLHWAASEGRLGVVMQLVSHGADVDADDDRQGAGPLGWATVPVFHPKVAEFLVDSGARVDLFPAIAIGRDDVVAGLLRDQRDAVLAARLEAAHRYERPLHFAALRGRARIVDLLLDAGADPVERSRLGLTPLAVAGFHQRGGVARKLEGRGARVDFGAALALGRFDEARHLLSEDPGLLRSGGAADRLLHYAAFDGHVDAARFLLEHGAPPDAIAEWWPGHRVAPIHLASCRCHLEIVRLLVHHGADLLVEDSRYKSAPRGWAIEHRCEEIVRYLREHEPVD